MARLRGGCKGGGGGSGGGEEDRTQVGRKGTAALAHMHFPDWRLLGSRALVFLGPCHLCVGCVGCGLGGGREYQEEVSLCASP